MKGVVFNLVQDIVVEDHGEVVWDTIVRDAGVDGAYTALGSYADEELMRIVDAAATRLGAERADVLRYVGRRSMGSLSQRYPTFFEVDDLESFLLTLNDVIHPEVRKLYPEAIVPVFEYERPTPGVLVMGYRSPRALCHLAEGFVLGAAERFGERVTMEQPSCTWRGDAVCRIEVCFEGEAHP